MTFERVSPFTASAASLASDLTALNQRATTEKEPLFLTPSVRRALGLNLDLLEKFSRNLYKLKSGPSHSLRFGTAARLMDHATIRSHDFQAQKRASAPIGRVLCDTLVASIRAVN